MERSNSMENPGITLQGIRQACGYSNFDAMRQLWYSMFGKENGFPEKEEPLEYGSAEAYLVRLSSPKANKPEQVVQGALVLLEGLRKGVVPEVAQDASAEVKAAKPIQPTASKPTVKTPTPKRQEPKEVAFVNPLDLLRAESIRLRDEEDRQARAESRANEQKQLEAAEKLNARLSPWINGLTWTLNGLEMVFLIGGLFVIAGAMGLVVGLFLAVLGTIVLLMVQLQGNGGGYAVFAWFMVCSIGGWLVEYPAMFQAIEQSGSIVSESGETYAGISVSSYASIVTFLMSGSSFAGMFFRYKKAQSQ
jgi:hypothetical protein